MLTGSNSGKVTDEITILIVQGVY